MAGIEYLVLEGYGYVVLTLVFYCFFNFWMAFQVGKARKKYNVSYPTLYASESENKDAKLFNCVQISFLLLVVCLLWLFAPTDGFGLWCFAFVYGSLIRHFEFLIVCAVKHRLVVPNRSSQNVKWDWARKSSRSLLKRFCFCFVETISVITNDGRNIVGVLKGFDQATNIILDESHERVYSTKEGVQQLVLGLYIIRGDNISIVGEIDEELDAGLDLSKLRAHPLKPVIH
ncbi:hypothetical protein RHMOL_Rhmol08G0027400 [Rhododendron molle]|uniref:Uncharacterized protein n=1 Tax=Rhododendron molle TaxID=49168 RepID=A0ACC0MJ40_RHOML|nr:hypothetical protein RHMOL_Rhmol08G0027400 [Rhododendron molle]